MTITNRALRKCAQLLIDDSERIRDSEKAYRKANERIYDLLTMRDEEEVLMNLFSGYNFGEEGFTEEIYDDIEEFYEYRKGKRNMKVVLNENWLIFESQKKPETESLFQTIFRIRHKLYFTLKFDMDNPEDILRVVRSFLKALKIFYKSICDFNDKGTDAVSFKFPRSLWKIFSHQDTLVIYFCNNQTKNSLKEIIAESFTRNGVGFSKRQHRSSEAFDVENKKTYHGLSHSEMVAHVITRKLSEAPRDEAKLAEWLKERIVETSSLPAEKLTEEVRKSLEHDEHSLKFFFKTDPFS